MDVDVVFPDETECARLDSQNQPKREPLDIRSLDRRANPIFSRLRTIYVGLPWLSGWLVAFLPFFQKQRERTEFSYVFLRFILSAWKNLEKVGNQRQESLVQFRDQCRAVSKFEICQNSVICNKNA